MASLKIKLRYIYLPFLGLLASSLVLYNTARWLLDIKLDILPIKSELLDFWLPIILGCVLVFICFKAPVKYLRGTGAWQDDRMGYQFVFSFALALPLIISQNNITSAPFSLIPLTSASIIQLYPNEKFFSITPHQLHFRHCLQTQYQDSITSRSGTTYYFHAFYSCSLRHAPNHWLSVMYYKSHDSKREGVSLQQDQQQFYAKARDDFATFDFNKVSYLERLRPSNDLSKIQATIKHHTMTEEPVVLRVHTGSFENRSGHRYFDTVLALAIACFVVLAMVGLAKLAPVSEWPVNHKNIAQPDLPSNSNGSMTNKSRRRRKRKKKRRK